MKKFFAMLLMFSMVFSIFADPPVTIRILQSGNKESPAYTIALEMVKKDFPHATFIFNKIDRSDGSTLTMDAQIAAGMAPNIYIDTMVRASKYMVPEFALPLDDYIRDLPKYNPGVLTQYRRNGKLLALPMPGAAQAMLINLDIMKEIGFSVPDNWTVNDFLRMAEMVKVHYKGKKWATGMFAANQSGDYLLHNWFAAFGAEYYKNQNYDRSVIADTGGVKAYEFFQTLVKNGYVPPNAASLNDDDYCAQWMVGDLAATAFFPNWINIYLKTAMDQGLLAKPFEYKFVPFPRGPGVSKVPTYYSNAAMIVHKTGTYADTVAARFAEYNNSPIIQGMTAKTDSIIPNREDSTYWPTDKYTLQVMAIVNTNGIYDAGLTDPRFTERRALQFPILQQVLNFTMKPLDAIKLYQEKLSAVD